MSIDGSDERLAALAERLRTIEEELGDLILDVLRDAVASGATKRPAIESRLSRARNAVTKAARLLDREPGNDDT